MTKEKSPLALWRAIAIVLNYFIGFLYLYPKIARAITLRIDPTATSLIDFVAWGIYIGMIIISVSLAWPLLKENAKSIHWPKFFENIALLFVGVYVISILASSIIALTTGAVDSNNEMMIQEQMRLNPVLMTFTTLIYAPLVEEIVFRGAIYRTLEPKFGFWISGIIAGCCFGMIHVYDSLLAGNFADCLYLIQYGGVGILFCYAYKINHSIYSPMLLHFINNFIATIVTFILLFMS